MIEPIFKSARFVVNGSEYMVSSSAAIQYGTGIMDVRGHQFDTPESYWLQKISSSNGKMIWVPVDKQKLYHTNGLMLALRIYVQNIAMKQIPCWFLSDGAVFYVLGYKAFKSTALFICDGDLLERLVIDLDLVEILRDKFSDYLNYYGKA